MKLDPYNTITQQAVTNRRLTFALAAWALSFVVLLVCGLLENTILNVALVTGGCVAGFVHLHFTARGRLKTLDTLWLLSWEDSNGTTRSVRCWAVQAIDMAQIMLRDMPHTKEIIIRDAHGTQIGCQHRGDKNDSI